MRSGPVPRNILRVICANEILIGIMIIFRPRQTSGDHVARVCALPHRENIAHGCNWSSSSLNGVQHDQQYLFCAAIQFSQLVGLRHKTRDYFISNCCEIATVEVHYGPLDCIGMI